MNIVRFLAALLALSFGPALPAAPPAQSDWNITDHISLEKIMIQGHRGVGNLAEENTVEAFELAWKMGLYPESDLRMTKDGVIVPFHDANFARVLLRGAKEGMTMTSPSSLVTKMPSLGGGVPSPRIFLVSHPSARGVRAPRLHS